MTNGIPARLAVAAFAALAATGLTACLGDGNGSAALGTYVSKVLDIDRTAKTITTEEIYWECDGEEAVVDSFTYEESFHIAGGKLYHWYAGNSCLASVLGGKSSDIVGTWSARPALLGDAPVNDSALCDEWSYFDREMINQFSRNLTITEVISETQFKVTLTGEICAAEDFAYYISQFSEFGIENSAENCSSINLTNPEEVTARIESSVAGGRVKMKFTTEGATCTANLSLTDDAQPDCTDGGADAVFESCVLESGFYGDPLLLKQAAAKSGTTMASRLRKAIRQTRGL